jgi:hypothetical protein
MRFTLAILLFAATLRAQRPTDAEASALIEKARAGAMSYTASLPDFLCTQMVRRYQDPRGDNRWQRLDVLTVKLAFSDHHEDYKLIAIDGKQTTVDFMETNGPTSKGEFGSLLLFLFHPKMEAEFHWKGWATVHKQRVAVFSYKVDQEHTQFHVSFGRTRGGSSSNEVLAPYFGEVIVNPESGAVLRITQHAVLPLAFPIRESSATVEYDYAEVGGQRYLLPLHAEVNMAAGRYKTRNDVEFKDYRKFGSEAVISFDK